MGRTIEVYIEKLKARVAHLEKCQADYEKEYTEADTMPGGYYSNSTELVALGTVIRDLSKLIVHEYSYWDIK